MAESTGSKALFDKGLISASQWEAIETHRGRNIFSIRTEILFLLFVSVSLFTGGVGIFIYKNIDTIGHLAILSVIFAVSAFCFYYSFKNAPGFSKEKVQSTKPLYDYLVLSANILSGIFIGYLQVQYAPFGSHHDLATLVPTILYFVSAYYFDHKGVLSLGISGLCAFVGFAAKPSALIDNDFSDNNFLAYYAIGLAVLLLLWNLYSQKTELKKHFSSTFHNFSMHISCIAAISQLFEPYWPIPLLVLVLSVYYYSRLSHQIRSVYFMSFAFIYGFIGLSSLLFHFIQYLDAYTLTVYLSPFYIIAAIIYFTKSLKNLRNSSTHESL